jgi:hypothetical protein
LRVFGCGDSWIFTFASLENGTSSLRRSQYPLGIFTIALLLWKCVAVSDWFEIKPVDEFLRGLNFNRGESDSIESIRDSTDAVATGSNFRKEVAIPIRDCSLYCLNSIAN